MNLQTRTPMVDPGFKGVIDQVATARNEWLSRLTSGRSEIKIRVRVRGTDRQFQATYLRHGANSVTVHTSQESLDWLLRGRPIPPDSFHLREARFSFLDVQLEPVCEPVIQPA